MYISAKPIRHIHPKKLLFFVSVFLVLAVFITGALMLIFKSPEFNDSFIELPFSADSSYFAAGDNIVFVSGETLTCINSSLKELWQLKINSSALDFISNGTLIAATNQSVLMVFNSNGESLFSKQINGTINSVRLGRNKVAVCTQQTLTDGVLSYITIFDLQGSSLFQFDITGEYVLDYGFDSQSEQLYTLEVDVAGSAPFSRISTYKPNTQRMTGIKELKGQLIQKVYISENTVYTMGTSRLSVFETLNSTGSEVLVYGWVLEDIYDKNGLKFVYIPNSNSDNIDIARIISASGDESKINLPPDVFKIVDNGEKIYCFASDSIFVYTDKGKFVRSYELSSPIDGVKRAMDGYVFLTGQGNTYLAPLP